MNDLTDFLFAERIARAKTTLEELRLKATNFPIVAADPEPMADQPGRWLAKRAEQDLLLLGAEIEQGIARIQQDARFTDQGRAEQSKAFAAGLLGKLARIEKMGTDKLAGELERARAEFGKATASPSGTDVTSAIAGMELRGYLRQMSDTERLDLLWRAVREGDAQVLAAFEGAPKALHLVDPDVLQQALAEFRRRTNPALAEDLDDLAGVHETITGHLRSMANVLDDLAGVEKPVDALMPSADNE